MDPSPPAIRKRTQMSPPPTGRTAADAAIMPSSPAPELRESTSRRPRRLAHPAVTAMPTISVATPGATTFAGFDPHASAPARLPVRGYRARGPSSASAPLLPVTTQDAEAATSSRIAKARSSVIEAPSCPHTTLATPTQMWLLCAYTREVDTTNNCLGDTVNGCLKLMSAKYSHVELIFGFPDGTWQALKTNMGRGTVLLDAGTSHYRNSEVWKAFRFCITEQQRAEFYRRAVAYEGSPFNAAALTLYTPGCYSIMRYLCCVFNCCFGISYDTTSGRYYCTQIVLLVMQAMFPERYGDVDATSIVPDALVPLFLQNGHMVADLFERGGSNTSV